MLQFFYYTIIPTFVTNQNLENILVLCYLQKIVYTHSIFSFQFVSQLSHFILSLYFLLIKFGEGKKQFENRFGFEA